MAGSVNRAIIIGRLGKDVELRYTPQGKAVANFSVATSEVWNDQNGEKQERTEWHKIVAWGRLGENCSKLLSKGKQAYIEGRLQTRSWDDPKDGSKRYTTEIIATTMQVLSPKDSKGANCDSLGGDEGGVSDDVGGDPMFDDIPFLWFGIIGLSGIIGKLCMFASSMI